MHNSKKIESILNHLELLVIENEGLVLRYDGKVDFSPITEKLLGLAVKKVVLQDLNNIHKEHVTRAGKDVVNFKIEQLAQEINHYYEMEELPPRAEPGQYNP